MCCVQGLNGVQQAPGVSKAMHNILYKCQRQIGGWVGSSVIHLGDHNVPNAVMFIDKYTQVSTMLAPRSHPSTSSMVICRLMSFGMAQNIAVRLYLPDDENTGHLLQLCVGHGDTEPCFTLSGSSMLCAYSGALSLPQASRHSSEHTGFLCRCHAS